MATSKEDKEADELLEKNKEKFEEEEGKKKTKRSTAKRSKDDKTPQMLDRALVDPEEAARERVEGTTSDAATRAEGTSVEDTPPDPGVVWHSTDAEDYEFPPGGDVEVATVEEGSGDEEYNRPLEVEDWVVLGEHELVPDRLVGRRAAVLQAPREPYLNEDADEYWITVRTRDEVNAQLIIPVTAASEIQRGGLATTHRG